MGGWASPPTIWPSRHKARGKHYALARTRAKWRARTPALPGPLPCAHLIAERAHADHLEPELLHPFRDLAAPEERVFLGADEGELRIDHLEIAGLVEVHGEEGETVRDSGEDRPVG